MLRKTNKRVEKIFNETEWNKQLIKRPTMILANIWSIMVIFEDESIIYKKSL